MHCNATRRNVMERDALQAMQCKATQYNCNAMQCFQCSRLRYMVYVTYMLHRLSDTNLKSLSCASSALRIQLRYGSTTFGSKVDKGISGKSMTPSSAWQTSGTVAGPGFQNCAVSASGWSASNWCIAISNHFNTQACVCIWEKISLQLSQARFWHQTFRTRAYAWEPLASA